MFFVLAYLLAVIDGTLQDKGLYPNSPGRTGPQALQPRAPVDRRGAICGMLGAIVGAL
jgi:hypothetical protein